MSLAHFKVSFDNNSSKCTVIVALSKAKLSYMKSILKNNTPLLSPNQLYVSAHVGGWVFSSNCITVMTLVRDSTSIMYK